VEPLDAVGPGAVIDDVGKMGVQGEGEKAGGFLLRAIGGCAVRCRGAIGG